MNDFQQIRDILERISKRPDLPNPERDADWKNCMKWSSAEAKEALATLDRMIKTPATLDECFAAAELLQKVAERDKPPQPYVNEKPQSSNEIDVAMRQMLWIVDAIVAAVNYNQNLQPNAIDGLRNYITQAAIPKKQNAELLGALKSVSGRCTPECQIIVDQAIARAEQKGGV